VNPAQWSLRNQIQLIVKRDGGRRLEDLAEITGADQKEIRAAVWALIGAGTLGWCDGWVVFAPRRPTRRPA
jgi:hypothetical protein